MSNEETFRISPNKEATREEIGAYLEIIKEMGKPTNGFPQFSKFYNETRDRRLVEIKQGSLPEEVVEILEQRYSEKKEKQKKEVVT